MGNYLIKELCKSLTISGFRRNKYRWISQNDDFYRVIDFQPSRYNTKEDEDFAINIGVYSGIVDYLCWDKSRLSDIADCCFQGRISEFFDVDNNSWFTLKGIDDIEIVKQKVSPLLQEKIVPFLIETTTNAELLALMEKYQDKVLQKELHQIYMSCVECAMGKTESALSRLSNLVAKGTGWSEKAIEVRTRISEWHPSVL